MKNAKHMGLLFFTAGFLFYRLCHDGRYKDLIQSISDAPYSVSSLESDDMRNI